MKLRVAPFLSLLALLLLCPSARSAQATANKDASIHKQFVLHSGSKGEPYTLLYPIELTRPGEIAVYARSSELVPEPKNDQFEPLRVVLVDARAFKEMKPEEWRQWVIKANKFNPLEWVAGDEIRSFVKGVKHLFGKKEKPPKYFHGQIACGREDQSESIRHGVDDPELKTTGGRYVVILRNVANLKATGTILIRYPGEVSELDPEVEKSFKVKPDLVVEKLSLNTRGQVLAQVTNQGKGELRPIKWQLKGLEAVTFTLEIAGRNFGVTLPSLDPEMALRQPGGTVTYLFEKPILDEPTRVTALIDGNDKVAEENERNNRLSALLTPRDGDRHKRDPKETTPAGLPDLRVTSIRLDARRHVIIEVTNQGPAGLDATLWSTPDKAPDLHLKMDGHGWSRVPLGNLDPRKELTRPGGVAVYDTAYVLKTAVTIDAAVDTANLVVEANEGNNTLATALRP